MARILSFRVEGLAGRDSTYEAKLNPDVNVFYGLNGSGKTTLLKILHSALSTDTAILSGLPFRNAEVSVYLNRHDAVYKRRFDVEEMRKKMKKKVAPRPRMGPFARAAFRSREGAAWTSEPAEPRGRLTSYKIGYLPITRLYRTVKESPWGVSEMSDKELDSRFAEAVQRLWQEYYAEISNRISQAQAQGIANILHTVLSGEEPSRNDDTIGDTNKAYERVLAFLSRERDFENVLGPLDEFAEKYQATSQIRRIVSQIDRIEGRIEEVTAPRSRLKELLESMYSGHKRIVFTEKEITVESSSGDKIALPSLSSGEKQLFFICLEALRSGNSSLIIDEPELSMHVDWQKKLVYSMCQLNGRMQLIMATHSPEVMAELPDEKVFSL